MQKKCGCKGCYYDGPSEEKMIDILQSFIDLAEEQIMNGMYEDLYGDVQATKWAINRIRELENEVKDLKKKLTPEAITDDLEKRYEIYNTCLHCGEGKPAYCERLLSKANSREFKVTKGEVI